MSESLQIIKDLFIVQCCFECRGWNFRRFTDNIALKEGIPYIHYLPQKHTQGDGLYTYQINSLFALLGDIIIMK